jgi:hypothetical protein
MSATRAARDASARPQVQLVDIQRVSTAEQIVQIRGELTTWWEDPRLAFNGTADGGCFEYFSGVF